MYYYEVAPTKIIRQDSHTFTYSSEKPLLVGQIVAIEVGKKQYTGIIISQTKKPEYKTKPVTEIIEEKPLPLALVGLTKWLSDYYATHLALVLQMILPRGIQKQRRTRTANQLETIRERTKIILNKDQVSAVNQIAKSQPSETILLHGVTGSGKTAVYIEIAKQTIESGKSVIVLVPEIALTSQLVDEFSAHFTNLALAHSRQTEAERHHIWKEVLSDQTPKIIIGPRSALFLPVQDVGMIIIDESHEPSYKQESSPKYSALRAARILADKHAAKLVLGSATPSISDYYLAEKTHSPIVKMPLTARAVTAPKITPVDMTKREHFKRHRFLSDTLLQEIEKVLASGNQVLIFHNRRGSAAITLCDKCGWQAMCQRCFVPLVLHSDNYELRCHICGHSEKVPTYCPTCSNASIIHKGIGTKLIESELSKFFPDANIQRFDGDSGTEDTLEARYKQIYEGKIDIIIGTQIVAKGLDLPKLRMVGVIQADSGLSMPDFASAERTFQLLAQVVGRVGRNQHETSVIVQSYQINHQSVINGLSQNYTDFYNKAIFERRRANFPPFTFLLQLTCTFKTEATTVRNSQSLMRELKKNLPKSVEILGPTPAFYERQQGTYRWQLLLKSKQRAELIKALSLLPPSNWQFELDPTSLL